jgi:hypothetical protein
MVPAEMAYRLDQHVVRVHLTRHGKAPRQSAKGVSTAANALQIAVLPAPNALEQIPATPALPIQKKPPDFNRIERKRAKSENNACALTKFIATG